eukprot:m.115924 g.115924  ORF g.115924 m.115924 type:complete len:367 (+) comp15381_c1_seq1:107-1207(+)
MGRITVLYETQTGCTEKMAAMVADGARSIKGMEVRVVSVHDADAPEAVKWADGLAVGTPTNLGGISWRMKKFWDDWSSDNWNNVDGKLACTFSSQGGHGGGAELTCMAMNVVLMNFGFLVFGVTDYVDKIHTLHYGACVAKEPRNQYDRDACHRLGLRLAEWVAVYVDNKADLHPLLTTKKLDARFTEEATAQGAQETKAGEDTKEEKKAVATKPPPSTHGSQPPQMFASTSGKVHLLVRISVPSRNQTAWSAMARELTEFTRKEPGCIRYSFAQVEGSETDFFVVEEYTSVQALEIHSSSEYFKRLVPAMGKISSTTAVLKAFPLHPDERPVYQSALSFTPALITSFVAGAVIAAATTAFVLRRS